MHMKYNSNFKNMRWNMMGRKWVRICTVVKVIMILAYFFTLHALTKFFPQYPQTTFSIIKVASPSLWPKGDRLTGQHHHPACASLLVTLALSTCWGSLSPPITAWETCPSWLHKSSRCRLTRPGFILAHHGTTRLHLLFSLSLSLSLSLPLSLSLSPFIYIYIYISV